MTGTISKTKFWFNWMDRYRNRPVMSSPGLYDPTTIMNADQLSRAMKEGWIKLGFYLLSFFYYLYGMIYSLIQTP
jgi:hypothetical protein